MSTGICVVPCTFLNYFNICLMDSDLGSEKKHEKVLTVWYPGLEMVRSRQGGESKTAANTRTLHLFKQGMLWKFNIYIENTELLFT